MTTWTKQFTDLLGFLIPHLEAKLIVFFRSTRNVELSILREECSNGLKLGKKWSISYTNEFGQLQEWMNAGMHLNAVDVLDKSVQKKKEAAIPAPAHIKKTPASNPVMHKSTNLAEQATSGILKLKDCMNASWFSREFQIWNKVCLQTQEDQEKIKDGTASHYFKLIEELQSTKEADNDTFQNLAFLGDCHLKNIVALKEYHFMIDGAQEDAADVAAAKENVSNDAVAKFPETVVAKGENSYYARIFDEIMTETKNSLHPEFQDLNDHSKGNFIEAMAFKLHLSKSKSDYRQNYYLDLINRIFYGKWVKI
jgi:ketosteroid isomerase-like protein